ncbi:FCD domain-containing protein [uncultured Roseobacter sp.]|uniref:FadR/GntR family transcriptional regulator n=1 Tax=uncultured Roseobacter sp. TaxID=114847 RepID=UPI002637C0F8|nr:FCD domain-containing protein [uncultured Roseobacter sp.]
MDAHALLVEDRLGHVSRQSMKDTVAEKLATLIASGVLSVGDELPAERDLAAALGVSRETIRGALLILSTRGILSVVQGARTTVASQDLGDLGLFAMGYAAMTTDALDDVHEARLLIEARVAALSAARIDAEALARLTDLIEAQDAALEDPVRFLILDREFHTVVYRACRNAVLADLATTLYSYLLDHRRRVVARPGAIQRSIDDHRAILAALRAQDVEAVVQAFGFHERQIYETTRQLIAGTDRDFQQGGDLT